MDGDIIVSTTGDVDVEGPCEESFRDESCLIQIVGTGFNVLINRHLLSFLPFFLCKF